jgi:hypothetical protein
MRSMNAQAGMDLRRARARRPQGNRPAEANFTEKSTTIARPEGAAGKARHAD